MFSVVCKKVTFFYINCEKGQLKFALFCVQDQLGLEIKIRDHFWTRFNSTNRLTVLELVNELSLKIIFFEKVLLSRFA